MATPQNLGRLKTMAYTVNTRKLVFRLSPKNEGCLTVQLTAGIHYMPDPCIDHFARRLIHTVTSAHCRTAPADTTRKCPTCVNPQYELQVPVAKSYLELLCQLRPQGSGRFTALPKPGPLDELWIRRPGFLPIPLNRENLSFFKQKVAHHHFHL